MLSYAEAMTEPIAEINDVDEVLRGRKERRSTRALRSRLATLAGDINPMDTATAGSTRAQLAMKKDERDRHARDEQRRANREPHSHPLAVRLDTSRTKHPFALHEVCTRVDDTKGRPMVRPATLDPHGIPPFSEGVILSMTDTPTKARSRHYLTVREVATLLGVHPTTVRDAAVCGKLHAYRTGGDDRGHYRISLSALRAYLLLCSYVTSDIESMTTKAAAMMLEDAVA